ncbi:unnamed protein product, partial [Effrenium voratum]
NSAHTRNMAAAAAQEFVSGPRVIQAAHQLLDQFSLRQLCEALATAPAEDAEPLISALEGLGEIEEVRALFVEEDVKAFLTQGVSAGPRLRGLVAKLLARLAKAEAMANRLLEATLFDLCEPLLLDEETGVAEAAAQAVLAGAKWPAGQQALVGVSPGTGASLAERLQSRLPEMSDVPRIRILALFVQLGRASPESFAVLESRGALEKALESFITEDLLLKLNAVELMDA